MISCPNCSANLRRRRRAERLFHMTSWARIVVEPDGTRRFLVVPLPDVSDWASWDAVAHLNVGLVKLVREASRGLALAAGLAWTEGDRHAHAALVLAAEWLDAVLEYQKEANSGK